MAACLHVSIITGSALLSLYRRSREVHRMGGNILVQMSVSEPSDQLRTEAVLSRHLLLELYDPSAVSTRLTLQAMSHVLEAMVP